VLATVKRDQLEGRGEAWPADAEEAFKAPIRAQYESQGNAYYATARLWDDGVIDPLETRQVLGLALTACANAPLTDPAFGVFRM
jgi:3-methylcrotonyl-CoA carboxylase beta subunit